MDLNSQPIFTVEQPASDSDKAKKKSSAVQIFKVALLMLRRRRSKKSKEPVDMAGSNKGRWPRLLVSMRPLHIQGNGSPPTATGVDTSFAASKPKEDFEESPMPLPSPRRSTLTSSFSRTSRTSSFGTSQYASANNLQELGDNSDDGDNDENDIKNDNGGDEMIDVKAEEFIAQFYEQMRLQRNN